MNHAHWVYQNQAGPGGDAGAGAPPAGAAGAAAPTDTVLGTADAGGDKGAAGGDKGAAGGDKGAAGGDKGAAGGDDAAKAEAAKAEAAKAEAAKSVASQKEYLLKNAKDDAAKKALEGKSDADIKKMFDEAKTSEVIAGYKGAFKLPDGLVLDEAVFGDFAKIAAKAGVSNDEMKGFMEKYAAGQLAAAKAPYELWQNTQKEWREQLQNDKEIGGPKLQENLAPGKKFISSLPFAGELRAALNFTGAGNNPFIVKALVAAGKMMAEGKSVPGAPGGSGKKSAAETLYPNQGKT